MSRYKTYKPSGIDWIGEVPEHWEVKRLKHILLGVNSGDGISNNEMEEDGEFEIYGGNGVMGYTNKFNSEGEVIVIGRVGAKCGVTYLLDQKLWISDNALQTRTYQNYKYLYYLLVAIDFNQYANQNAQPLITGTIVKNFPIPFVKSKEEQLTIANYLDEQTQKIDRLIANKKAQAEKLKELRQIEINHAVTKGLNPSAEMKDSGIEWLGKIPKHWEVKRLKNVADINATKQELKYEEVKDREVVFLAMESVSENGQIDNSEKRPVSELWEGFTYFQKNDVIIAKITPCFENGKGAWLNNLESDFGFGSTEFHTVRGHKNRLDNHYFYHVTKSDVFMKIGEAFMTGSAGQKRVSTNFVLTFKLAFPPIKEQIEISNYLQKRTTAIDQLIKNIEAQIEKLQELRKIKIYEAVTGKIKVNAYAETTA